MNDDVINIGSSAGGGTLARHLAASGKKILILERGDFLSKETENWDVKSVFVENRSKRVQRLYAALSKKSGYRVS